MSDTGELRKQIAKLEQALRTRTYEYSTGFSDGGFVPEGPTYLQQEDAQRNVDWWNSYATKKGSTTEAVVLRRAVTPWEPIQ